MKIITETIFAATAKGVGLIKDQKEALIDEAELRLKNIADSLAAKVRTSMVLSAVIIFAGLVILAASIYFGN